jgi:hypothetical protein
MNPKAKQNIVREELPEETLIYDLERDRAHCLNPTAAFLLGQSDGEKDVAALARATEQEFGSAVSEEFVELGLERLARARLLDWDSPDQPLTGITRRAAIRRLAVAGLAVPAVMTIVSPLPAQTATAIPPNVCNRGGAENSGKCCTNGKLCILTNPARNRYQCRGVPC